MHLTGLATPAKAIPIAVLGSYQTQKDDMIPANAEKTLALPVPQQEALLA
jgi:hypothetical protein